MSEEQCWSVQGDGSRCARPAQSGSFFCSRHRYLNTMQVSQIWRAPEAEMPRELVAGLRRADPAITFPAPAPSASREALAGPTVSGLPPAVSSLAASPAPLDSSLPAETSEAPLEWLLVMLRAAMEGVMAGEATPLQKANAIARLAGQHLKASGAQEQARENKALTRRLAVSEARVAALEARLAAEQSRPLPTSEGAILPVGSRQPERTHLPDETRVLLNAGEPPAPRPTEGPGRSQAGAAVETTCVPP